MNYRHRSNRPSAATFVASLWDRLGQLTTSKHPFRMDRQQSMKPGRALQLLAVGLIIVTEILGNVLLSAPQASAADCALTPEDQQYMQLLVRHNLGVRPGKSECDAIEEGQQIAAGVRESDHPRETAEHLRQAIYLLSPLSEDEAMREVALAIEVYAPELIPVVPAS